MNGFHRLTLLTLLANWLIFAQDQCKPIGWATRSGRTGGEVEVTGGGSVSPITVTTYGDLEKYAGGTDAKVIYVQGNLGGGWSGRTGDRLQIGSNKTIVGIAPGTQIKAALRMKGSQNVILRNIVIIGPGSNSDQAWDNLTIEEGAKNIWVDHCEFLNGQDGNADVVKGADNVTFTWCVFGYTQRGQHNLSNLIASSDNEPASEGKLNITIMSCWFKNIAQRGPRCRYGNIHVVNNLYTEDLSVGESQLGVTNGYQCNVRTENNHFIGTNDPIDLNKQAGAGSVQESISNLFENCSGNQHGSGSAFNPPYEYKSFMVSAQKVKALVQAKAGATLESPTACLAIAQKPTLTLTSGDSSQKVPSGNPISDIVYTWGGTATGVIVSDLPNGLTSTLTAQSVTISGTPTEDGIFTITTTQDAGTAISLKGSISLLPGLSLKKGALDTCTADGVSEDKNAGFDELAYLNLNNEQGAKAQYAIQSATEIQCTLMVHFANGSSTNRSMEVKLNDQTAGSLTFAGNGDWTRWQTELLPIHLQAGHTLLTFTAQAAEGGPNLDWIGFSGTGITNSGCDPSTRSIQQQQTFGLTIQGQRVSIHLAEEIQISLFSMTGQTLYSAILKQNAQGHTLDLSQAGFPPGIYILQVISAAQPAALTRTIEFR